MKFILRRERFPLGVGAEGSGVGEQSTCTDIAIFASKRKSRSICTPRMTFESENSTPLCSPRAGSHRSIENILPYPRPPYQQAPTERVISTMKANNGYLLEASVQISTASPSPSCLLSKNRASSFQHGSTQERKGHR